MDLSFRHLPLKDTAEVSNEGFIGTVLDKIKAWKERRNIKTQSKDSKSLKIRVESILASPHIDEPERYQKEVDIISKDTLVTFSKAVADYLEEVDKLLPEKPDITLTDVKMERAIEALRKKYKIGKLFYTTVVERTYKGKTFKYDDQQITLESLRESKALNKHGFSNKADIKKLLDLLKPLADTAHAAYKLLDNPNGPDRYEPKGLKDNTLYQKAVDRWARELITMSDMVRDTAILVADRPLLSPLDAVFSVKHANEKK